MLLLLFVCFVCVGGDLVNFRGHCRLEPDPSVEYRCLVTGAIEGTRACEPTEPPGTIVVPHCRRPNYYAAFPLTYMKCFDGYWDYVARCSPECGRVTPDGKGLVVGGRRVKRGELPWHAGIYSKMKTPYMQICGGSLISNNVVLSAAHCFWDDLEKQLPASQFAVAVGKLYRPWDDTNDEAQKSDVKVIHLPPRYQGALADFQDDIAVVIVANAFHFKNYIRPVCLSFDYLFEKQQLYSGNNGKVAGWGLTAANGKASPVLLVVDLPFVEVGTCIKNSPPDFREYITSDKICAGTLNSSSALCRGDSGGGLAFPELVRGIERYFLRGVVSTAANSENACNVDTYTSFTSITKHEQFIKEFWSETGQFKCQDGSFISAANHCDGTKECVDGSDESEWACATKRCSSYLFRCNYGACVDNGARCNGVSDCADGSDEAIELCEELGISPISIVPSANATINKFGEGSITFPKPEVSITFQPGQPLRVDYGNYNGKVNGWFKRHAGPADWDTANLICQHEGAEVAVPKNADMITIMKELIASAESMHDVYFAGVRQTFSNSPIKDVPVEQLENNWGINLGGQQCLGMSRDGKVSSYSCGDHLPYICYKKFSSTEIVNECGTVDAEYKLNARTRHCYKLHSAKQTWERAQTICVAEGGHLAVLNGDAEAAALSEVAAAAPAGTTRVAVGFREWGDAGSWWTVQGQMLHEAGYDTWCKDCPQDTSTRSCGALNNNKLDNIQCDVPYPFICEKTVNSLTSASAEGCLSFGSLPCSSCVA